MRRLGTVLSLIALSACSARHPSPTPAHGKLADGVVATVGHDTVSVQTIKRIARAERVSLPVARKHAINDALFAAGARERFDGTGRIKSAENAALARALLEQLKSQAEAEGPVTDAEVTRLTELHWYDLDRPASVRTTHAVVLVKKPADDAPAKALAQRILEAVDGVHDPAEFKKRAEAVPTGGLQVRVETLAPVAADGRVIPEQPPLPGEKLQHFDKQFAEAANAITKVGEHSPVVRSKFGYHVILLDKRLPAKHVSLEQRRKELAPEAIAGRAGKAEKALLKRLRASTPVQVVRSFDDLTSRVRVQP